jgi:uncharacterized Tic20 family protein
MTTDSEKSSSMLIHLSALSSYVIPFGSLLLPLILWQSTKKDSPYIDHHGKEAVNFNLSFFIYNIISVLVLVGSVFGTIFSAVQLEDSETPSELFGVLFSTGGFLIAIIVIAIIGTVKLIILIVAAIQANNGKLYRCPLTIRFIK